MEGTLENYQLQSFMGKGTLHENTWHPIQSHLYLIAVVFLHLKEVEEFNHALPLADHAIQRWREEKKQYLKM